MLLQLKPAATAPAPATRPRRRWLKPVAAAITIVAAIGALAGWRVMQAREPAKKKTENVVLEFAPSDVAVVEERELSRSIGFSGSLAPVTQSTVKTVVPGTLSEVLVREGQSVTFGQLMATISAVDLQSKLDAQVAALEEAKARLSIAEKNRENNKQLLNQKFISQNAFDTTQSVWEAAEASVRNNEAQVRLARKAVADTRIAAPFAGIVARRMVNAGESVGVDGALFQLVDLAHMEIEAPAPASEIPAVRVGQDVRFAVDGFSGRSFKGRVERINPTADANSRSIMLYISVANPEGELKGGMFAKGQIVLGRSAPAPVIPASALRDEAGQSYVYTVEHGEIRKRAVKLGFSAPQDGMVEVSGLERGLAVVSARLSNLKPGTPAVLKPASPAPVPKEG
jgi:membrane fusion protein (multidrug efflux system)